MSILDSLFSKPQGAPDQSQTDYTAAANQGAAYNAGQISNFESYSPGFTSFIKNLYGSTVNPQATSAQNTQFNVGNQLATQGYTSAQGDFFNFARQQGLESAAATGAPVSSAFGQNLGTSLGAQTVLQNQLQGTNLLNSYSQNQQNLALGFMAPSQQILSSSLVSPTAFMQGAAANNTIANQNAEINFANGQQHSWFDNVLTGAAESAISTPFSLGNNANSAIANSPQTGIGLVGSICGGSQPASNTSSPYNLGTATGGNYLSSAQQTSASPEWNSSPDSSWAF